MKGETIPDASLYVVGTDDAHILGVLSSRVHVTWALVTGGHLGVGNHPRYQNGPCFSPFPFPAPTHAQAQRIRDLAEALDSHRKRQQAEHPKLTITGMYNVLEKLRSGADLDDKEKVIHQEGLVSVLKKLHDELDAAVFDAYGWPADLTDEQILERLVALNAERVEEEKKGLIRWLRPDFQAPKSAAPSTQGTLAETDDDPTVATVAAASSVWPKKLADRIAAIRDRVRKPGATWSVDDVAGSFKGAKKKDVEAVLESLAALGLLLAYRTKKGPRWKAPPSG